LYLYCSLVAGDFDKKSSDIDLLVVITSNLDGEVLGRLGQMHARLAEGHPAWDDRIEVAYAPAPALRRFKTEAGNIAIVSPGEPFHTKAAGKDWLLNWYTVREIGVALLRPSPRTLIPEISKAEFVEVVREQAEAWRGWVYEMRHPGGQAYAVLTTCRALYTHTHGEQASKRTAALWAQGYLPRWASLIRRAWGWRGGVQDEEVDIEATFSETVRFVHDVSDRITVTPEGVGLRPS
jgi:hypothetical protein